MYTNSPLRPDSWIGKTMSILRANQLEACEKDLAGLPFRCLFDGDCTDTDAEIFYGMSFFPREDQKAKNFTLHTVEQLRVRVLRCVLRSAVHAGMVCPLIEHLHPGQLSEAADAVLTDHRKAE